MSETPPTKRRCARYGCTFPTRAEHKHCSFLCKAIDEEVARAQRICQALDGTDSPLTAGLLSEISAVADGWNKYRKLDVALLELALSVGITREQWQAIKRGHNPNGDN